MTAIGARLEALRADGILRPRAVIVLLRDGRAIDITGLSEDAIRSALADVRSEDIETTVHVLDIPDRDWRPC